MRCKEYLYEIGNHPFGKAVILNYLAGLHAMQDDFAAAQATLNSAKNLLDTLGAPITASTTQPAALIAMLAGDPATAEEHLRLEYDFLCRMGERRYLASTAPKLARVIAVQGQDRYDEAIRLIAAGREAASREDLVAQALSQGVLARILADRGRHREAENLARSAAALAAQTDFLSERAGVQLDLAHVLAALGRVSEAHAATTHAIDLYKRKGNLPGIRESLRHLAYYAPARKDLSTL
jgi:tetratricopeptide (TPR) repeat protein